MPRAPDIAPARRTVFARADVDILADVDRAALRQVVGIETGGDNRGPQHVGLQAGEGGGQQDIVGAARDQHRLVPGVGHALGGGDELGAHVGEIAAERLRGAQRVAVADAAGQHDRPVEERAHRADEHEGVEPAGLAAGASRQQHQPVGACCHRALGVADAGDIGEDKRAGVMQRRQHRRRRTDRGDDEFGPVPQQHLQIGIQPRIGAVHDQVRADRRRRLSGLVRMTAQPVLRYRRASRRAVRGCGSSPSGTRRSRRCGRPPPPVRRRRRETSAPRSAAG